MTDIELIHRCAKAMGYRQDKDGGFSRLREGAGMREPAWFEFIYNPLQDDAQALELVKRLRLHPTPCEDLDDKAIWEVYAAGSPSYGKHESLNRAIVECVAGISSTARPRRR